MRVGTRFSAAALLLVCLLLVSASAAPKAKKEEEKQKQMKPHLVQGNSPLHNAARKLPMIESMFDFLCSAAQLSPVGVDYLICCLDSVHCLRNATRFPEVTC